MKMEKSKAFLVSSEAARDRCQALSPAGSSQRRSGPTTTWPGQQGFASTHTQWERRGATHGRKGRYFTLDRAVKKGALWVLRFMIEDGEKVGKWHFLDWKRGRILLHLGCSECRKDIFEEISI